MGMKRSPFNTRLRLPAFPRKISDVNEATATGTIGTETFSASDTATVEAVPSGAISGTVWADTNNDDIGDAPIAGVTVELLDSLGNVVATTTTLVDGSYSFTNILPGDYQVRETQPAGYDLVSDKDGGNLDLIGDVTPITVTAGATNSGNDFVEYSLVQSRVQCGLTPTMMTLVILPSQGLLLNCWIVSGNVIATTTTLPDGSYSFTDVPPGDYQVHETQPAGYNSVSDRDGEILI